MRHTITIYDIHDQLELCFFTGPPVMFIPYKIQHRGNISQICHNFGTWQLPWLVTGIAWYLCKNPILTIRRVCRQNMVQICKQLPTTVHQKGEHTHRFAVWHTRCADCLSMLEMTCLHAKFCRVPVRNACGKKNPEIQNTCTRPPTPPHTANYVATISLSQQLAYETLAPLRRTTVQCVTEPILHCRAYGSK